MFTGMSTDTAQLATDFDPDDPYGTGNTAANIESGTTPDGDAENGDAGSDDAPRTRGPARGAARGERSVVRRAARKALEIDGATADAREMLASLLACKPDTVSLTVAALSTSRSAVTAVGDLFRIADAEDLLEAGVLATEMAADRARLKAVWSLLETLGAVQGAAPGVAAKAGLPLARAATSMESVAKDRLHGVLALLA